MHKHACFKTIYLNFIATVLPNKRIQNTETTHDTERFLLNLYATKSP